MQESHALHSPNALDLTLQVSYPYRICFTHDTFALGNTTLQELLIHQSQSPRTLVLIDQGLTQTLPNLECEIRDWFSQDCPDIILSSILALSGGEQSKVSPQPVRQALQAIIEAKIDRHSYVIAIGGGAFLDIIGFAAALAHRGVRLVRIPTTTLSQADSGVGVKNGINYQGQKNYLGTFAVPWATVNDARFLHIQPPLLAREGLTEAVKVAVVKDAHFFEFIESHIEALSARQPDIFEETVNRSATLHALHIATNGDPFELGSSRPLDFGHWAAHFLESMSGYTLTHGEAVSLGICLDLLYSVKKDWLPLKQAQRIVSVLHQLGMPVSHPLMGKKERDEHPYQLLKGLDAFREHLGGELTILMLHEIGRGVDVHDIDIPLMSTCLDEIVHLGTSPLLT
ncbi:MAG: 3-dehydroquinate synthase [Akkermansia sp.]